MKDMIYYESALYKGCTPITSAEHKKLVRNKWQRLRTIAKIRKIKRKWFEDN